jgi:acyl-CoA thioester hydrolase
MLCSEARMRLANALLRSRHSLSTEARRGQRSTLFSRSEYRHFETRQTRWNDADVFGHVNNAVYYIYIDDAVNQHLHSCDIDTTHQRFVAESSCRFLRPLKYPEPVDCGLRVTRLGTSSVAYAIGLFAPPDEEPAAQGTFVHVYVGPDGRPTPMNDLVRKALMALQ